jgi:hypothetical protein
MNLYWGNFDFEHDLAAESPRALPAQVRRLNDELAFCLAALAEAGDCVWAPAPPEPQYADYLEQIGLPRVQFVSHDHELVAGATLVPWGWSQAAKDWGMRHGCPCESRDRALPDLAAVARANSREFSSALETEWGVELAGAHTIRTVAQLEQTLSAAADFAGGWVIKANFGMSARERILSRRGDARPQDVAWARRRLQRGEPIFFEPWVEAVAEFGCQLTIPRSGPPCWEGTTGLLSDEQGTYRGSRLFAQESLRTDELLPQHVIDTVERAAVRVQHLGYFGPLGIDVMQYRTVAGEIAWRPLQDINARLTMGRVALGWRRLLAPKEAADWLHLRASRASLPISGGARLIRTSPREVGGQPATLLTGFVVRSAHSES